MGKIIIHNTTELTDADAVGRALRVMHGGKVSKTNGIKHYCHATRFVDCNVFCLNRGEDKNTFYVYYGNVAERWRDEK